ncbi:hypothetical protein L4D20_04665 [Vibrio kyushuensis]|uniref:hypothetical protein n=1 Tax=Vibrio kyushuensis TaxID=2910249 RepID=UPI003D139347
MKHQTIKYSKCENRAYSQLNRLPLLIIVLLFPTMSNACQLFYPMLQKTLADRLIESENVVMVRTSADSDRLFHVKNILKGEDLPVAIEQYVPLAFRNFISVDPDYTIVMIQRENGQDWLPLGVARRGNYEQLVKQIIDNKHWIANKRDDIDRLLVFAKLLGNQDLRIHELAYLEVARAPYEMIMEVSQSVDLPTMRNTLNNFNYANWHGLATLILGSSSEKQDEEWLSNELQSKHKFQISRNLAAVVTAWIEMKSTQGLDEIISLYIKDQTRTEVEIEEIILALSTHANATPALQDEVVDIYSRLLKRNPKLVTRITKDLVTWKRWDLVNQYQQSKLVLQSDLRSQILINTYLNAAISYQR